YFFLFVLGLGILYFLITGPYRKKFGGDVAKPTVAQQWFFYVALLLLYVVKGSPIDLLTHIMLSAHMAQMAIYYIVFPILILKGIPEWIWLKLINQPIVRPLFRLFTKPLISLLLFNGLFSLYHIPAVFDFSKSSQLAHSSISIIILIATFIILWPIVTPIRKHDTIPPLLKMAYIIGGTILITPACVLIIFADNPLFAAYGSGGAWIQALSLCVPTDVLDGIANELSGPEMFSPMSRMEDQQLGGIVMKIMQEIVYGIMIAEIFFKTFSKESKKIDPL